VSCCRSFHVENCGEKDYKDLLEQYPKVTRVYLSLEPTCQAVIKDICHRMGVGMAEFIEKEVITVEDYDLYCHYVAGSLSLTCLCSRLCAASRRDSQQSAWHSATSVVVSFEIIPFQRASTMNATK
jgi:phytoene/squalene synthetase